ncbi:MAG TPA: zinc ribbon domain-containing protein [Pyrinomonadaceae bacterium]|nr:zinc ribbon domain-containing protein [Pyrinomonadaceae bacterium]
MYCQTCGTEIQTGLNYCNRCGAAVGSSLSSPANRAETTVVDIKGPVRTIGATITLVTLLGLSILFFALGGLASAVRPLPADLLGVLSVVGLLMILIIDVMLIRILSRLVQLPVAPALPTQTKRSESRELHPPAAQTYMPASTDPLPVSSVTDHTTRTFHPSYKEPRANG